MEACLKDCLKAMSRLVVAMDGEDGGKVADLLTAAVAMAAGQSLTRLLTAARVPEDRQPALVESYSEDLKLKLLAYVGSPLYWRHRTGAPAKPPPRVFQVEGGWVFQPRSLHNTPSDGVAFDPRKPKKGRHDAYCLGGLVVCDAWPKPRRLLGPCREDQA